MYKNGATLTLQLLHARQVMWLLNLVQWAPFSDNIME